MGMRKFLMVATGILVTTAFFSCGGGGGDNTAVTSPTATEEQILAESPVVESFKVGDTDVVLSPTTDITVQNDDYAVTSTAIGIISPVKFTELEDLSNDTLADDNVTVGEIFNNTYSENENPPFVVISQRPVKKPLTTQDGKLAILMDISKIPFDMSAGVVNYKTLLALPDNGYSILEKGYIPLTDYSGDIGFFDTNRKRIWNINSKFIEDNVTLDVYAVIPYSEDANSTFSEGGNYTIFVYNPDNNTFSNGTFVTITTKETGVELKAILENGVYPFVLAKEASKGEIIEVNGTISLPYNLSLKGGIVFTDNNGKVVGIAKINTNNTYTGYYVKSWLSDADSEEVCPKATVVSVMLKDGKYELEDFCNETTNIELPEEAFKSNYPIIDNNSLSGDKAIVREIMGYYGYYLPAPEEEDLKFALYPENVFCDSYSSSDSMYYPEELCSDFSNLVYKLINGESMDNQTLKDEYSTNGTDFSTNCTILSKTITDDQISISIECIYSHSYSYSDGYYSSYSKVEEKEKGTYSIQKNSKGEFLIKWSENSQEDSSYSYNGTLYGSENYTGTSEFSGSGEYILQIESGNRKISNYHEEGKYSHTNTEDSKIKTNTVTYIEEFYPQGTNNYLGYLTATVKRTGKGDKYSYSLSYDSKATLPFEVSDSSVLSDNNKKVVIISNIDLYSSPFIETTINSDSVLLFIQTGVSDYGELFWNLNGADNIYSIVENYELDEMLEALANETSNETTVEGQVVSE